MLELALSASCSLLEGGAPSLSCITTPTSTVWTLIPLKLKPKPILP